MMEDSPARRRYAVIGTGALGAFYGARLQRAGLEVHFLVHSDFEHVRDHGLTIESVDGDFRLPRVNACADGHDLPPCDVVAIALKTTHNDILRSFLTSALKPNGVVLVLQNGLGIEEDVATVAGSHRVMSGLCFLCSNKAGPGHIRHLDYGAVALADYVPGGRPAGITRRMREIASDFAQAGISVRLEEDLLLARWKKLVWNIPYNGLSVVLNATTDLLMADAHTRQLVMQIMGEVVTGAAACGRTIPPDFVDQMLHDTDRMKPYQTSMQIDFEKRRPMEVEAIFGNPLRAAGAAGTRMPTIDMLYRQLKFLDARNMRPPASGSG